MRAVRNIWFLSLATCREVIRLKTLWAIVGIAILLTMGNLLFSILFTWDLGKVSIEFGLSAVSFTGLLIVFFLGMKIMADDLERSRIYMVLSRPISIWQYLAGKFLGLALVLLFTTIILGISAGLSMQYMLQNYSAFIPPDFSWLTYTMALICQYVSLLVVLAISFFWFSFASQSFVALLLSTISYLVCQNMELLRKVVTKNAHAGFLEGQNKAVELISWIFPNLSLFDKKYVAAYGFPFSGLEFLLLMFYGFSCSFLLLWFATLLFKRKELG